MHANCRSSVDANHFSKLYISMSSFFGLFVKSIHVSCPFFTILLKSIHTTHQISHLICRPICLQLLTIAQNCTHTHAHTQTHMLHIILYTILYPYFLYCFSFLDRHSVKALRTCQTERCVCAFFSFSPPLSLSLTQL